MSLSITTKSLFYYGHTITDENNALDFSEGGPELLATLSIGNYTITEFAVEIERAMNEAGALVYTVTLNRTTRKITIAAGSNFELLVTSGSRFGTSVYSLIGFTGADLTSASSYEGNNASGFEYRPQAVFRDYESFADSDEAVDSKINESSSGVIEAISFGDRSFMECEIWGVTNLTQTTNSSIETNATGREDARAFMTYARKKRKMEFMEDRDTPATFNKILLEKTRKNRKGTGYRLQKDFNTGVEGYFTTGNIMFREVA